MSDQSRYFKVGLFVILGVAILLVAITLLGAGDFFREKIYLETYFDESVQGVDIGTPIKYRGVQIGNIDKIDFVRNIYDISPGSPEYFITGKYVYVRMSLKPGAFGTDDLGLIRTVIERMVQEGLRIQMAPLGITGLFYLEANYFDPRKYPPMEIHWEPENLYIPSTPSLFAGLTDSVKEVFSRIEQLDIEGILTDAGEFLEVATSAVRDASVSAIGDELRGLLAEVRQTNGRILDLLQREEWDKIPGDASGAVAGARRIIEKSEADISEILVQLHKASENSAKVSDQLAQFFADSEGKGGALGDLKVTLEGVRKTSEGLPETVQRLNDTLKRIDRLIAVERDSIQTLLTNMESISENLREITENAKRYPSQMIFGAPPPKTNNKDER